MTAPIRRPVNTVLNPTGLQAPAQPVLVIQELMGAPKRNPVEIESELDQTSFYRTVTYLEYVPPPMKPLDLQMRTRRRLSPV